MKLFKRVSLVALSTVTALGTALAYYPGSRIHAADDFRGRLQNVQSVVLDESDNNIVYINYNDNVTAKVTFLEDGIFRFNVDPTGEFSKYATPRSRSHKARIQQYPDESSNYSHPNATVTQDEQTYSIKSKSTTIVLDKATAKMKVMDGSKTVLEEKEALLITDNSTVQTLVANGGEDFYGGGTQNGRFIHTGETINVAVDNTYVDGSASSPSPFYYSSNGYGVLRNTFSTGQYDFGDTDGSVVTTTQNESEFDAYFFVTDSTNRTDVVQDMLQDYFHVTGNPMLLPEYGFYLGHLNCYNRDAWSYESGQKQWTTKGSQSSSSEGTSKYETGMDKSFVLSDGQNAETLNGKAPTVETDQYPDVETPQDFSAQTVLEGYSENDMPLGFFLPNDGYGCGYGQNGYMKTGGVSSDGSSSEERLAAVDANVKNLQEFTKYANSRGVSTGLWTESNLTPDSNSLTYWHRLRDFNKEVNVGGITTLKTDVAWVGSGYSMALDGIKTAYETVTTGVNTRPNLITLDGWAGTQRYGSIWTGDQTGGNWEYIRFHIPTYIGQSLAGNPNIGSDMDGIFGGSPLISTRDYQWKTFTPQMLDMDGWGSYVKSPQTHGDPYTGISRMYLKLKAQLMPYIYTSAASAANIDTGNDDTGLPMIRAMFLEYPEDNYAASKSMQYQYMFGSNFLVAPVYQDTAADELGNDIRNNIYLPDEDQVWIDYFTGKQYRGGQVLNNFDAPLWKLPLFVKSGAIVPMYEENNNPEAKTETNPDGLDKANRIVEFWPDGTTEYTSFEDDGKYVENNVTEDDEYGKIDDVSYGDHVSTKFTSTVEGDTATLTANTSKGTYKGYDSNKNTTFVVNVSKQPDSIVAKNGDKDLEIVTVDSKEAFDAASAEAGKAVYFYDANPTINTYAPAEETEFASMVEGVEVSPKLYVKFAQTDVKDNAQTLIINGFANEQDLGTNDLNPDLAVPELSIPEDSKTPTSITLNWNAVDEATSYELKIDGVIFNVDDMLSFIHDDLDYNSTHTYQVRARNANGYSQWSEEQSATSLLDPWRNVPESEVTKWNGGDSWGNLENAFDHSLGNMFHSSGDAIGEEMIIDLKKAYQLDKFEYYARNDNYGNGTVNRMTISVSLDGTHWTTVQDGTTQQRWTYDKNASIEENKKVVDLSNQAARYVKLVVNESVGNFFSAAELAIYKLDGTNAFEVGSNLMQPTVTAADETNMRNYLAVANKEPDADSFLSQIKGHYADINNNDVYDVYDYAFTAFKLDGGTTQTGKVDGELFLLPNKENVTEGETFTVDVYASDVKNVNALGALINYDANLFEVQEITKSPLIASMENYSANKMYTDGSGTANIAFANKGDKELFNGSGVVATVTFKAKADTATFTPNNAIIIGPEYDFKYTDTQNLPEIPDIPLVTTKEYQQSDFNITMTNDVLPTDDGTNVEKIVQSSSYDSLFNGTNGREFEFKYYIPTDNNVLPDEVKLPTTLHFAFKEAKPLTTVNIYNPGPSTSNGYVIELNAVVTFEDETTKEFNFTEGKDVFTLDVDSTKKVTNVDITPVKSTGKAQSNGQEIVNDPVDNRMLTLGEIDFLNVEEQKVTSVELGDNREELYVGDVTPINATVKPDDIKNPYYTVESSNPDVASIIKVADGDNIKYYVRANGEGTAEITVTSVADETKSATYTVTCKSGINTEDLLTAIEKAEKYSASNYTEETYAKLSEAVKAAKELLSGEDYTVADVLVATEAIEDAIEGLVYRPIDTETLINKDANTVVQAIRATSECHPDTIEDGEKENVLDYNESTYWHTDYIHTVGMPQSIVFDLKDTYNLTDITFLPRQNGSNGDIFKAEILVSLDDQEYVSLGVFEFDNNGVTLDRRDEYKQITFDQSAARYVEFKVLNSGGDSGADRYASMSEIRFYGNVSTSVDKSELQSLYDQYLNLDEANYTPESWVSFANAMTDAKNILDRADATQEEVNNAKTALETAYNNLVEQVVEVNKDALKIAVDMANAITDEDLANVVQAVVDEFKAARDEANEVYNNASATQEEVNNAFDRLANAMHMLDFVKGDKAALEAFINKVNDLVADQYTPATWEAFAEKLANAKVVLANENAMQEEVDSAYKELVTAFLNLRLIPNKDLLEDLINKAEGLNVANYTSDSWNIMQEALNNAKNVFANPNVTQEEVDNAKETLAKAVANLQAKSTTPVSGGDTTAIKTGDTMNAIYPITGLALAGAVLLANKKRKEN